MVLKALRDGDWDVGREGEGHLWPGKEGWGLGQRFEVGFGQIELVTASEIAAGSVDVGIQRQG